MLCVILLRPLRSWLESHVKRTGARSRFVEEYHINAMAFLKSTDPEGQAKSREVVIATGEMMMDGTRLIRGVLFVTQKQGAASDARSGIITAQMADLSDEQRQVLGHALGAALLVSTFQSRFFGKAYRSILMLMLRENDSELKEPEQIVRRFGKAKSLFGGRNPHAC